MTDRHPAYAALRARIDAGATLTVAERRDVLADFAKAFGPESMPTPAVIGIAIGADTDNTHGRSLGFVADLVTAP